jgi:hypothetical protein
MGAATDETPTPTPPINRNEENKIGLVAIADPIADRVYSVPIPIRVFYLPKRSQGIPPKTLPITVPHRAIDITKNP